MSLYLGENLIAGTTTSDNGSAVRNLGEIVCSTVPVIDAGLHILDGAVISGSGIYSEFVSYIAGLYNSGGYSDLFTLEGSWQQAVSDYGVCGKFVYDSVNNTVRLPKYNSKIYTGGGTAPVVGNGMTLGLTNGATLGGLVSTTGDYVRLSGITSAYGKDVGFSYSSGTQLGNVSIGVTTDSSKSGIITELSNITTALDGYYYIVVATTTKTDIQVDIDEITTDLNGKCDVDGTNATFPHIVETYVNGASWYRLWSDGWCEQGGELTSEPYTVSAFEVPVVLLQSYKDTNYNVTTSGILATTHQSVGGESAITNKATTGFNVHGYNGYVSSADSNYFMWYASGYVR